MNKTAIKNFSIWARNKLIDNIRYRAGLLGITENGISKALPQSAGDTEFYDIGTAEPYAISGEAVGQRRKLAEAIREKERSSDYRTAYQYIVEEVAYTWFNRLIAIRFMEVNDYLPAHIRVLSSDSGKLEPDLVTTPFDAGLSFTVEEEQTILRLKQENQIDELFRLLFIKQCNALNEILPGLFEKTNDYTELLLSVSVVDQDGIVYRLTHDIDEEDFNIEKGGQVEIIGWLYQYWNIEPKNAVFGRPSDQKIKKEEIPAATQLFTPDWIVRYMVENSLGRVYIDKRKNEGIFGDGGESETPQELEEKRICNEKNIAEQMGWKYYIPEAPQEPEVQAQLAEIYKEYAAMSSEDIKCIDPCMGSGHILCYMFDVLIQVYESQGYGQREAVQNILQQNLYGLDIDDRAYQLAYFAIMMKARQYDRRFFAHPIQPNVYAIQESNWIGGVFPFDMGEFLLSKEHQETLNYLIGVFQDAKEYGSILQLAQRDYVGFTEAWNLTGSQTAEKIGLLLWYDAIKDAIPQLAKLAMILTQKYHVVCTNPPYMSVSSSSAKMQEYVKNNFPDSKADLFSVFIERCSQLTKNNCYQAMITQQSWMFTVTFETLRKKLSAITLLNLLQFGARGFDEIGGEVVQTAAFVFRKTCASMYIGSYIDLTKGSCEAEKESIFQSGEKRYLALYSDFQNIPNSSMAYWISHNAMFCFGHKKISDQAITREGMTTANNELFLRFWHEIMWRKVCVDCYTIQTAETSNYKWFPYNKGGANRKWYGNNDLVVNWENDGFKIKNFVDKKTGRIRSHNYNADYSFRESGTWTAICSGNIMVRYSKPGALFDSKGASVFASTTDKLYYIIGMLNSKVSSVFLKVLSPSYEFKVGHVANVPLLYGCQKTVIDIVSKCILLSKADWDSFETSWDFVRHPLVRDMSTISEIYTTWKTESESRFNQLKSNEEELNCIFIDIYGLQDELTPDVEDKDVTVRKADLGRDIRSLLSYAVGCMFGRYSIYKDGLAFAGGEWNETDFPYYASQYYDDDTYPKQMYSSRWFLPDEDNILPITDEEYLNDDVVSLLCEWLKKVYGADTLEQNLDFIAKALGNKGTTSREVIRNYFLKDFFADHCRIYQKRPIYWLFDSGKQNGFKALIYLHRYTPDTIGNLRIDYLHRMQRIYESEIDRMQDMIDHINNSRETAAATKRKEKLQKQLKECREYDEKISHLALSRIALDLDDGVKVNYRKVQTASDSKFYEVLADSRNIMGKK